MPPCVSDSAVELEHRNWKKKKASKIPSSWSVSKPIHLFFLYLPMSDFSHHALQVLILRHYIYIQVKSIKEKAKT